MTPSVLARELESRAHAEGFDAIGIAAAGRLDRDGAALAAWLRRDHHASMAWMARDPAMRADPRELLPGCRSVIALALNYGPQGAPIPAGRAQVALYARGRDYHKILGRKLRALAAWIEETTQGRARAFVDTGPVLERAWAERAGVGWIGKNANLITRDMGSWILLGDILTTAELEPDAGPHPDHCGSCALCIQSCPTSAIVAPGVVDSSRCISYWTIEHRGPVPAERRVGNGDWIFGCDECQTVCPWNESFARSPDGDPFGARDDLRGLDPVEVLGLDEASFRKRFSGTAIMRARRDGMRRNACIVLGNRRDARAVPALAAALSDPDPTVRGQAAWALGQIGDARAIQVLRDAAGHEPIRDVLTEIDHALP